MSGAGGPIPCAARVPQLYVPAGLAVGKHEIEGWKVVVMPLGADGRAAGTPMVFSPEQAAKLGEDLIEMANVCEGKWGDD